MLYSHDTMFMIGLLCSVIVLRCLLHFSQQRSLVVIKTIVSSWIFLLAVLFFCYALGFWTIGILSLLMFAKGLHEIFGLWQKDSHNPRKVSRYLWRDGVLVVLLSIFCLSFFWLYYDSTNKALFLWVLFCVQINDVCQYIMGKALGQRFFASKLAPNISPKKTIEGVLFGIPLMASIGVLLAGYLIHVYSFYYFSLAVLLGVFGVLGDLLVSKIKRTHHIKDMGAWLKGHGGLLDRIDSLLLALPVFWVIDRLFLV